MQENFAKRACFVKCLKLLPKNALFCEDALYWIITLKGTENNESVLKNKIYCVSADKQTAKKNKTGIFRSYFYGFLSKFKTGLCWFSVNKKLAADFLLNWSKGESASVYLSGE